MSLAVRIFRGSTLNLVDLGLRIGVMFWMTPFMLGHLGIEAYGIWLVLTTAIGYLNLLDAGVTLSGTRFLARAVGQGDERFYVETAGTLSWLYQCMGWLCLAGTAAIAWVTPWILQGGVNVNEGRLILAVLGGSLAVRFFLRIHLVVLKSQVRYDLIVVSGLVKLAVQSCMIIFLLKRGHGLVMLALAQAVSDLVDQLLLVYFVRRERVAGHAPRLGGRALLKEILSYSAANVFNDIGQALRGGVAPLVLSKMVGSSAVAVFNVGMRLLTLFFDSMNAVLGGPLLAGFCQLEGSGGLAGLRGKFLQAMRISVPLVALGGAGLFVYGPAFLQRWLGEQFSDSGAVMRMLVLPFSLWLMQLPATNLLMALGRHHLLVKATFIAGVINLILSIIFTREVGFFGVVLSALIEMTLFYGIILPIMVSREIGVTCIFYLFRVLGMPLLKMLSVLAAYALAVRGWLRSDYMVLACLGGGMGLLAAGVFWFWIVERSERLAFLRAIRKKSEAST